jgi:YYY domain-containing protein
MDSPRSTRFSRQPIVRSLPLVLIMIVAAALRFYDLNWDQSQYNHPDERHVTNVISALRIPESLNEYLDSGLSPLNPYNLRQSWVYGTLPLFGGRWLAEFFDTGCAPANALIPRLLGRAFFPASADCQVGFFTGYEHVRLVGRMLSAIADLLTVLAVYLTGRRWFGRRTGLLAAAFSAFAVLQIQHSKFFVVESLLTMCSAWCLYFCARISSTSLCGRSRPFGLWFNAALAGLFSGLAVASKISVWPTAVLVVLSIIIALWRDKRPGVGPALDAVLATVIAGVVTFAGFRIAQPYGFVGSSPVEWQYTIRECTALTAVQNEICSQTTPMPETVTRLVRALPTFMRPILAPSSRWVAELQQAAYTASGQFDPPFGWQWANRAPVTFPLGNIVFYGLGVPLGLSALLGVFFFIRQLLRGRRMHAYLVPTLWTVGFFLYQGTQYVKSIRYQLPIYPMLCVIAAALLVAIWRSIRKTEGSDQGTASSRLSSAIIRPLAAAPGAFVLAGTIAWAFAFMQIYNGELTRTEASRWMYAHVPTAVTVTGDSAGAARQFQLPVMDFAIGQGASYVTTMRLSAKDDRLDAPLTNVQLRLNRIEGAGEVRLTIRDANGQKELQTATALLGAGSDTIVLDKVSLQPNADYVLEFSLLRGNELSARTAVIANQHWDEGIPFRIDGKDGFGGYYRGISTGSGEIPVYEEEDPYVDPNNPGKTEKLLNGLDEADILVLNSNRHYASVARLPWRFPMTNAYFEALMRGELGFELAADFYRFPQLGPFVFNDQEMPQTLLRSPNTQGTPPGIEVPYPPAEEAFSVYDHPRVLIFRKTPAYTRAKAEAILGIYDLTRTIKRTAFESSNTPGGLLLSAKLLAAQRAGGTWSELYPANSPLNQSQPLAALAWLALIEAVGLATFFILATLTRPLAARGWALPGGGYAFAKALGLLLVAWLAWFLASAKIATFERSTLIAIVLALLVAGAVIGHLHRADIIALLRSRWRVLLAAELVFLLSFGFWLYVRAGNPDLWHPNFGGEKPMDFAYFNSILKATYFPPQDPWFAGGYINYYYFGFVFIGWPVKLLGIDPAVAYNIAVPTLFALTALGGYGVAVSLYSSVSRSPSSGRLILAGLLGALFVAYFGNGKQIDVVGPALQQVGGAPATPGVIAFVMGFVRWLGGAQLPIGTWQMYWDATRPAPEVLIGEFPNFTFLYADLHAHMMAMPLALSALGLALIFAAGALKAGSSLRRGALLALAGVGVGALWPANTWDYFPYMLLCVGAIIVGQLDDDVRPPLARWVNAALSALPGIVIFVLLTRTSFAPYFETFGAGYNQIDPWTNERTQVDTYITIHGLFLIPIVVGLLRHLQWLGPAGDDEPDRGAPKLAAIALLIGLAVGGVFVLRSSSQSDPAWTSLISAPIGALAFAAALRGRTPPAMRVMWLMTGGALALTLFVEHFTLRGDLGRMNTLFKFYIAAWLLLGTSAAAALMWLIDGMRAPARATVRDAEPASAALTQFAAESPSPASLTNPDDDAAANTAPVTPADPIDDAIAQIDIPTPPELTDGFTPPTPTDTVTHVDTTAPTDRIDHSQPLAPADAVDTIDHSQPLAPADAVDDVAPLTPSAPSAPSSPNLPATTSALRVLPFRIAFMALLAAAMFMAALYPVFAIPAKIKDRYTNDSPRGLDGMAYMLTASREEEEQGSKIAFPLKADYDAMRWLQNNVQGSPTIMEGTAGGNQYRWAGRFSIYTGLPSVVGWQWHQRQQRGESLLDSRVIYDRFNDVEEFYSTTSAIEANSILKRYGVRYVIVSPYERIYNTSTGFAKFPQMAAKGDLIKVYEAGGVTIYEVARSRHSTP